MSDRGGGAVRPAGAPMVPVDPPVWASRADDGGGAGQAAAQAGRQAGREVAQEARAAGGDIARELRSAGGDVGGYLRDADLDSVSRDARRLGRERPMAVAVGALAVGLIAGRIMTASAPDTTTSRGRR